MVFYCFLVIVCSMFVITEGHGSHHHEQQPTGFGDPNVIGDQGHMKQHMQGEINTDKPMSSEEMEFHYFRLHDTNNDTMLDGLELLKALSHMIPPMEVAPHEINRKTADEVKNMKNERTREMINNYVQEEQLKIIDNVLLADDLDMDGYLTYTEYVLARKRDTKKMKEVQERILRDASTAKQQMLDKQQQPYNTGL